ncbi:hypothetical protein TcCL_ESM00667 [Trypanosoma cruzi]|nr:hypothetical protein TcCL_ESM00667 [Trypanosoma cruzi]
MLGAVSKNAISHCVIALRGHKEKGLIHAQVCCCSYASGMGGQRTWRELASKGPVKDSGNYFVLPCLLSFFYFIWSLYLLEMPFSIHAFNILGAAVHFHSINF